jgi:hypothetical protein
MVDFNEHTRTTDLVQKLQIARRELKLEADPCAQMDASGGVE